MEHAVVRSILSRSCGVLLVAVLMLPQWLLAQGPTASGQSFKEHVGATASPAFLDMRAWSVGTGLSHGLLGVEVIRRLDIRSAIAVGAGAGGLGARAVVTPFERVGNIHEKLPYLSIEAMYAPWRIGSLDAPGAVGATIGLQWWGGERSPFRDVGVGVMTTRDGTLFGRRVVPTVRFAVGRGRPY
jgi:hypothetical protein